MEKEEVRKEAAKLIDQLRAGGRRSASTRVYLYLQARKLSLSVPDAACGAKAVAEGISKLAKKRLDAMAARTGISRDELEDACKLTVVGLLADEVQKGHPVRLVNVCQAVCDDADIYSKSMDAERLLADCLEDALA
ncbi:hypothetical protein VXJ24_04020 [Olsenella sp. YH-ols2221]|uniref:hypothetical protein n=1 Tax=Olsenella kribbiana TaxID=3115221 RepID=UPI002ED7B3E3